MIKIHILGRDGSHQSPDEAAARHLFETGALPSGSIFWEPGMVRWRPVSDLIRRFERQRDRSHSVPEPSRLKAALGLLVGLLLIADALHLLAELSGLVTLLENPSRVGDYAELQRRIAGPVLLGIGFLRLAVFVTFFCWLHRTVLFASTLGAEGLRFTPAAAVWSFFIPFLNLWRPYQVLAEAWQASVDPGHWRTVEPPPLLAWFWLAWTGQWLAGFFAPWGGLDAWIPRDFASSVSLGTWSILVVLCGASEVLLLFLIVNRLGQLQVLRSEEMKRLAATGPPRGLFD